MKPLPDWHWNELSHAGTDYGSREEVEQYDRRMSQVRDVAAENAALLEELHLATDAAVIEIGCGTAAFARAAAREVRRVVAVDISPVMLDYAAAKAAEEGLANIEFHHGGFLSYSHAGEPADAVVSALALHHLPDLWKAVALDRVAAMLKPGGQFLLRDVVFDWTGDPVPYFDAVVGGLPEPMRAPMARHIRQEYSTVDWIMRGLLERAGFRITEVRSEQPWLVRYRSVRA